MSYESPAPALTILLHKPSGVAYDEAALLLQAANRSPSDHVKLALPPPERQSATAPYWSTLTRLACLTPIETGASGLVVFSRDLPVNRKLTQEAAYQEHEFLVQVSGEVSKKVLDTLNLPRVHVSISSQSETHSVLRFALKGYLPGHIAAACERCGISVHAMRRLRIGRIPLARLEPSEWRCLMSHEFF